ncbi:basic proline-rich protein-like [Heterocephalus glaber]|uniref:Basic proline-rich protein-like n=1 Tax=Heterocephalus glaber TaxID=10181 RepID=A0AAX6SPE3_HETGA|nr:basic proline-rich protein-like [Heterocephalus glaber]XP_021110385.1 basic proline-rich protein-like [Heterocephalus glaber]XP_021110390.1 basic proline-rich protein-like [Heterocephalus glaber]XP_021110396.1 basic proline-rich protein-like [Heterocephalus glaber]XP_021110404.1 basic proline-rich protein-like [Heterocephalus glaber]XP_021110408.1 basic proline-rich protein-like [Heterocephalus glaber]
MGERLKLPSWVLGGRDSCGPAPPPPQPAQPGPAGSPSPQPAPPLHLFPGARPPPPWQPAARRGSRDSGWPGLGCHHRRSRRRGKLGAGSARVLGTPRGREFARAPQMPPPGRAWEASGSSDPPGARTVQRPLGSVFAQPPLGPGAARPFREAGEEGRVARSALAPREGQGPAA